MDLWIDIWLETDILKRKAELYYTSIKYLKYIFKYKG